MICSIFVLRIAMCNVVLEIEIQTKLISAHQCLSSAQRSSLLLKTSIALRHPLLALPLLIFQGESQFF